jgi:hypothetical protein
MNDDAPDANRVGRLVAKKRPANAPSLLSELMGSRVLAASEESKLGKQTPGRRGPAETKSRRGRGDLFSAIQRPA